jgi:hypothetical protein
MEKMMAYCGLICTDCPAYIATQKNDNEARKKVAEEWSKHDAALKPEDINCDGCLADTERLFKFCNVCEVRKCGKARGVVNCAYCDDYGCDKLTEIFKMAPEAKTRLDELRKTL